MKTRYSLIQILGAAALCLVTPYSLTAAMIWNGPTITFTKAAFADYTQPGNQDRMTSDVWLTRANTQGLFNIESETSYTHNVSPQNTEWAYGELANYSTLAYLNWETWIGAFPPSMVGQDAVLHLISDNIYMSIKFTAWGELGASGGSFSYQRSTPVPEPSALVLMGVGMAVMLLGSGGLLKNRVGYRRLASAAAQI